MNNANNQSQKPNKYTPINPKNSLWGVKLDTFTNISKQISDSEYKQICAILNIPPKDYPLPKQK